MSPVRDRRWLWMGIVAAIVVAALVAPWASRAPDGLEHTAAQVGLTASSTEGPPAAALAADDAPGVHSEFGSRALAGVVGVLAVLALGLALGRWLRRPGAGAEGGQAAVPGEGVQ